MNVDSNGMVSFTIQPHDCSTCGHQHAGEEAGYICIGCPCPETPGKSAPIVVQIKQGEEREVPAGWYDGKPKRCPGSDHPAEVQYHGEVSEDGEPKYLCRCKWCDVRRRPGQVGEHTFIPVRDEDWTFKAGKVIEGIEPGIEDLLAGRVSSVDVPLVPCDGGHFVVGGDLWMADLHEAARQVCACVGSTCVRCMARDELDRRKAKVVVILGSGDNSDALVELLKEVSVAGEIGMLGCIKEPRHLNKRRIDLAEEVIVANFRGEIPPAMADDIEYAELCGKRIRWMVKP